MANEKTSALEDEDTTKQRIKDGCQKLQSVRLPPGGRQGKMLVPRTSLRQINGHLLRPLLDQLDSNRKTVAIIDSTDLAAAAFKKTSRVGRPDAPPWGFEQPNRD